VCCAIKVFERMEDELPIFDCVTVPGRRGATPLLTRASIAANLFVVTFTSHSWCHEPMNEYESDTYITR
jgi:hypothetical protein